MWSLNNVGQMKSLQKCINTQIHRYDTNTWSKQKQTVLSANTDTAPHQNIYKIKYNSNTKTRYRFFVSNYSQ